jgi:membrane-associated phospholipid phosphatase
MIALKNKPAVLQNKGFRWYLLTYSLFLLFGLVILLSVKYGDVVLFINGFSRMEWDRTADWITRIGLGSTMVIAALGFALYKLRYALMMLFNLALVGIVTGIFKNLLFPHIVRPLKYFEPEAFHRMVRLFDYNLLHSFPSGHSMTIFAMMSLLAYFSGKRAAGVLFVLIAVVVGLTRIYLLQHFFVDVYVGSVLGVLCTLTTIWMGDHVVRLNSRQFFEYPFLGSRLRRGLSIFSW